MRYFPLTDSEREEIKSFLGIKSVKDLFSDLPRDRCYYPLDHIPSALTENRLIARFRELAGKNTYPDYLSFLGGGAYRHFIPEVVNYLSGKGELLTPYTPYQPEVSQGSLQAMFEYQTMMAMLTAMDVANSSLYDGGTATAEGVLLALRKSGKNRILAARSLHPEYLEIIDSYLQNLDIETGWIGYDSETGKVNLAELEEKADRNCGGFVFQSPNFFGVIEESQTISEIVHRQKAYSVQVTAEAMSLPFLSPPGENGVDISVGEAQSFGLPLGFGGPYLGFMAARKEFLRQLPGRIVGETVDGQGRRGYVLTLSTREQHIRREKATSNICTNQAWCALRAAVYLSTMGKTGLREVSKANHLNAAYFAKEVSTFPHVNIKYKRDFYNEVVLEIRNSKAGDFLGKLEDRNLLAGIPLGWFYRDLEDAILVNFTELHEKGDIDTLIHAIGELR